MFLTKTEQSAAPTGFGLLRREMDRLFDDWAGLRPEMSLTGFRPQINVVENHKHLVVTAELPGLEENDIEVELTPNALVLRGEKSEETLEEDDNWYRKERTFGSFERSIPLPWKSSEEPGEAKAKFKNGLLKVTVDRPADAVPRVKKVEIKAA